MKLGFRTAMLVLLGLSAHVYTAPATACGGLFCQNIPVDQAGEQILFHQDGEFITAMVRILYEGDSENFSWVVPVPDTPVLSTGADAFFDELDISTRPRFLLDAAGNGACASDDQFTQSASLGGTDGGTAESDSGVTVEDELVVGPFDIQIISSTNPDDMTMWLEDNDYDLSSRGRELIAPYVNDGMKFVAAKLRSGQSTGSIQPLIMKYRSAKPMVPIKLTAVAALENMGVLVWLVADARGVPDNYLHVVPNYTQLNWFTGPNNAYGSYQNLITAAMDEVGGQGFATDFAGTIDDSVIGFLSTADSLELELNSLDQLSDDNAFLASLYTGRRTDALRSLYERYLPLPQGQDQRIYTDMFALQSNYTNEALNQARVSLRQAFMDVEIEPLRASTALLTNGRYLTRLYTTLSADDMTLDPSFAFNPNMGPQSRERRATLVQNCENDETVWSLILGEGTGRDGETVLNGRSRPVVSLPSIATAQSAVFSSAITSGDALPDVQETNQFERISLNANGEIDSGSKRNSFLGGLSYWQLTLLLSLVWARRKQHKM